MTSLLSHTTKSIGFIALLIVIQLFSTPADAGSSNEHVLVPASGVLSMSVNGSDGVFSVTPDGSSYPVVNADIVERLHIRHSMVMVSTRVGSVEFDGHTGVVVLGRAGQSFKKRILWFNQPIAKGLDGRMGPGAFPESIITFILQAPARGEHTIRLPMIKEGNNLVGVIEINGHETKVRWNLGRPESVVSAATGQDLAVTNGGRFTSIQKMLSINFDVDRPVRELALIKPLALGSINIAAVDVRTSDYGSIEGIPDAVADPDKVTVTARKRVKTRLSYLITVGMAALQSCSSLTFDKQSRQITMSCQ